MMDKLQDAALNNPNIQEKSNEKYHFDRLKMYFGEDYEIVKGIVISQPTIKDILEIGEENFYHSLSPFLYNSTTIRLFLWENQIDWNTVKDIEVFSYLIPTVKKEPLKLLFKNINFEDFRLVNINKKNEEEKTVLALYSKIQDILLYENDYLMIAEYIREMMNMHPKVEKAKGKTAKNWIIQEDKMNLQQRKTENTSTLLSLISGCINHPGFKYNLQELKDVGICQFMDSVKRIQKYETSTAALKGMYSGFVDVKSLDKELIDFMGDT